MENCINCNKELEPKDVRYSDGGCICCKGCVEDMNELDKPCSSNSDIEYLSRNELVDLVYNLSVWDSDSEKDLDYVNEIILNYRRNK